MKVLGNIWCLRFLLPACPGTLHEAHSVWWLWWCYFLGFQHSLADVSFFLHCTWLYKNQKNADGEQFIIKSSVCCYSLTSLWFSVWFPSADPVPWKKDKNYVSFFIRAFQSSCFPLTLVSPLFSSFLKKMTNFRWFSPFVWFLLLQQDGVKSEVWWGCDSG